MSDHPIYEIHLYVPKTGKMTRPMLDWLFQYGQSEDQPEDHWPVRRIKPRALARLLLKLDPTLEAVPGAADDVELHYPDPTLGLVLYGAGVRIWRPAPTTDATEQAGEPVPR